MKKLVFYVFVTFCGLLNMSAGCSEEKGKVPKPESSKILGYWKLRIAYSYGRKTETGEWKKTATSKPDIMAYEFFENGTYVNYDLLGNFPEARGTWKLEVKTLSGKEIELAFLSLYADKLNELENKEVLESDGSMRFHISTDNVDGVDYMVMNTKGIKTSYPYNLAYIEYHFAKRP